LSEIQEQVLEALAAIEPAWTLTGGAALAGFYTKHRETRDQTALGTLSADVVRMLTDRGFSVAVLRTSPMFAQLDARSARGSVVIDLVADPTPIAERPTATAIGGVSILVETPHQLLVNKLCALLSRSELRDLVDVRALLGFGAELERAIRDCPNQDAGFSPLTFSWAVKGLPLARLARATGWSDQEIVSLEVFRDELVDRVVAAVRP
jgi:Nucleotidyl transferase AbiEii toxin, Type IV TA system